MTIDEAIEYVDDINATVAWREGQEKDEALFDNLADWLEELKIFKELYPDTDVKSSLQKNYEQGRADAINKCIEFVDGWDSVIADALANNMKNQIE